MSDLFRGENVTPPRCSRDLSFPGELQFLRLRPGAELSLRRSGGFSGTRAEFKPDKRRVEWSHPPHQRSPSYCEHIHMWEPCPGRSPVSSAFEIFGIPKVDEDHSVPSWGVDEIDGGILEMKSIIGLERTFVWIAQCTGKRARHDLRSYVRGLRQFDFEGIQDVVQDGDPDRTFMVWECPRMKRSSRYCPHTSES